MSWIRTFLPSLHCHSHISHSFPLPWLLKEPLTLFPGRDCCALIILSQIGRWTYTSINQTVLFIHSNFQCLPTSLRPKPCISLNNLPLFLSSQSATCHPLLSSFSSSHAIFSTSPQLNQTVPALGFWVFFFYTHHWIVWNALLLETYMVIIVLPSGRYSDGTLWASPSLATEYKVATTSLPISFMLVFLYSIF